MRPLKLVSFLFALCTAAHACVLPDNVCLEIASTTGVHYDTYWKTFDNVSVSRARPLFEELFKHGAYTPVTPQTPPPAGSARFGPTFAELNPGAGDTRPTLYKPATTATDPALYGDRVNPWEVGASTGPAPDHDYWTSAGQVAYDPLDPSTNPGLDRIQTFAYYSHVYAISPRFDGGAGRTGPEPFVDEYFVGGVPFPLKYPICAVRNYAMTDSEAVVIYQNGYMGTAGMQTSRGGQVPFDFPLSGFQFPSDKHPSAVALTTENEFVLVTVHDSTTGAGQLAVIAAEGHSLPFHTLSWIGLPNQGSWSNFKLMGYIDLPFAHPDSVSASTNGYWDGPSQTGGSTLGQIDITDAGTRYGLRQGEIGWAAVIATKGYAIVSSKQDGKVAIVDLTPVVDWIRHQYLDDDKQAATLSLFDYQSMDTGSGVKMVAIPNSSFPGTFTSANTPTVVWVGDYTSPTCVLAGCRIDRWSADTHKAYIATESGVIHMLDTSSLVHRWDWEPNNTLAEIGTITVGRNPVSMCFARFGVGGLPLIPSDRSPDPWNNQFHVACRGDRRIDSVVTFGSAGQVYQTISDTRMGDPVCVSVADRGNIMTVADYNGKKLLSFRIGPLWDRVDTWGQVGAEWDCGGPGHNDPFEFAGSLDLPGYPFWVGSSNLN